MHRPAALPRSELWAPLPAVLLPPCGGCVQTAAVRILLLLLLLLQAE
jgi:hypothetical protein